MMMIRHPMWGVVDHSDRFFEKDSEYSWGSDEEMVWAKVQGAVKRVHFCVGGREKQQRTVKWIRDPTVRQRHQRPKCHLDQIHLERWMDLLPIVAIRVNSFPVSKD